MVFASVRIEIPAAGSAPLEHTLLLPVGGHFVGDFDIDLRPHGVGTQYHADGSEEASGDWRNGQLHGLGVRWNQTRSLLECGRWSHGKLVQSRPVPCINDPAGAHPSGAGE